MRRRAVGGVVLLLLAAAAVGSLARVRSGPAHAAAPAVPSWLPALRGPVAPPTPAPLGVDWLALHPPPDLGVDADGAVLVDLDTRELIWARDPHGARPPASLTKLLTVLVAVDLAGSLDEQVTVPAEATQLDPDGTMMGLSPGEVVTVRDLLEGVFMVSGNDAAETLARAFTSRQRFLQLMSTRAAALGMRDSQFTNPTGLDDPGLRASPYDLAIAAVAIAARYPEVTALAGARDAVIPATDTHKAFFMHSLIKLVAVYPGATGLKSGYTDDAGYCLVGTATRGNRHLAVVLMHDDLALTADAARLLDYGFGLPRPERFDPSTIPQI